MIVSLKLLSLYVDVSLMWIHLRQLVIYGLWREREDDKKKRISCDSYIEDLKKYDMTEKEWSKQSIETHINAKGRGGKGN